MDQKSKIQESIKYIENNLCEEINLKNIARQAFFSDFYFHRLFRSITGKSVMEYVRERRLAESAEALAKTDEKITDIAHKYQYGSEEAFSRAFRKVFGISPREYRNTWNENQNVNRNINHSISQNINQNVNRNINHSISQNINHSVNRNINHSINQNGKKTCASTGKLLRTSNCTRLSMAA